MKKIFNYSFDCLHLLTRECFTVVISRYHSGFNLPFKLLCNIRVKMDLRNIFQQNQVSKSVIRLFFIYVFVNLSLIKFLLFVR